MPHFPSWNYRWNVLALTILSQALIVGIHSYSFSFWVVPWSKEFATPRSHLMLIITFGMIASGLIAPAIGSALDKLPIRAVFCGGALLFSGTLFLISEATSVILLQILYAGPLSIGMAVCGQLGTQTLVNRWFDQKRGFALGLSAAGVSLGALLFPPIVTSLLAHVSWREAFRILALGTITLLGPASWLVLSRSPAGNRETGASAPKAIEGLFLNRDFWVIAAGFVSINLPYLGLLYSIGPIAHDIGIEPQRAAFALSVSAAALAVSKLVFGKLADLLPLRRLYRVMAVGVIIGITITANSSTFPQFLIGLILTHLSVAGYYPLFSSMIVARFGAEAFGRVAGRVLVFVSMGAAAPYFAALIREWSGNYTLAFLLLVLPPALSSIAISRLSGPK